jgi:hypothetical protein
MQIKEKDTELAKRDAQIREKDAEISTLQTRLSQVERVPAVTGSSAKPAAAAAGGPSKKRSRPGTTASFQFQRTCYHALLFHNAPKSNCDSKRRQRATILLL